jgi:hypothetical protein
VVGYSKLGKSIRYGVQVSKDRPQGSTSSISRHSKQPIGGHNEQ